MEQIVTSILSSQARCGSLQKLAAGVASTFRDIPAGEVFGEYPAIDGRNRFTDAVAVQESLLASMPPEARFGPFSRITHPYANVCYVDWRGLYAN
jgi:hypothetical protein